MTRLFADRLPALDPKPLGRSVTDWARAAIFDPTVLLLKVMAR